MTLLEKEYLYFLYQRMKPYFLKKLSWLWDKRELQKLHWRVKELC